MSQDVQNVQTLIELRKKQKKLDIKKRMHKFFRIVLIHITVIGMISFYFYWTYDAYTEIDYKGLKYLESKDLQELTHLNPITLLNFSPLDLSELEANPLIKSMDINASLLSSTSISIVEYRVLAQLELNTNQYLLETGDVVVADINALDVPLIMGYSEESYQALAKTLNDLNQSTLVQISTITRYPQEFDANYSLIRMQDGIMINTGFNGYQILDQYESILKALNPNHRCLSIDEMSLVPYSFQCTLEIE